MLRKGPKMATKKSLRSAVRAGVLIAGWKLVEKIGAGGNGTVWRARNANHPDRAIKILNRRDPESYARFRAEVQALKLAGNLVGLVPIIDGSLSEDLDRGLSWFAMPLATKFEDFLVGKEPTDVVREFVPLAHTLGELHRLNIFHRDIKPANLLALGQRLCFSDFGLVKFPARGDITALRADVGPKFTMAPEMRRDAQRANGAPADVYSFCKTLWIALTKQRLGFDGQYSADGVLALRRYLPKLYTTTLDELLTRATDNDPAKRPIIADVETELLSWLALVTDFEKRNPKEWEEVQNRLFPLVVPNSASWTDFDSICSVLRLISQIDGLNHMFMPSGGGMTITGVSKAGEPGMITLLSGICTILKPARLSYESFGPTWQYNYFRLEAERVSPIQERDEPVFNEYSEYLCEIEPGVYVDANAWEYGEYLGEDLPQGARPITRYLKGAFVIFSTQSLYNLDSSTYDARHQRMTEAEFRSYIGRHALSQA